MTAFTPGVLESLVGVTFSNGSLVLYATSQSADGYGGTLSVGAGNIDNVRPGAVTVTAVHASYTAAFNVYSPTPADHYYHYFATFGTISLSDGNTYTIFATSSNGLVLGLDSFMIEADGAVFGSSFFTLTNTPSPTYPLSFNNDATAYVAPVCFAEGSRILTARGEVAVEDLIEGDEVVTASGGMRPVIWIGSRHVRCDRHPRPAEVHPVRVRAGAFGDGLPARDLRLSPGHAVAIDGVLVPISLLANGATIVQEQVDTVRYFHVELDAHDVILAEGLACESYFDDGNRDVFGNAPGHLALYGRLDPQDWDQACLPVVRHGPQSEALRQRLLERAGALGWTRGQAPQVTLDADGEAIAPVFSTEQRLWFLVPAARTLVLRSPAAAPALTQPGHGDWRRLGVAVSGLRIGGQPLDLASDTLGRGFHVLEHHETETARLSWRWTDGAAELPATSHPTMVEIEVLWVSPRWIAPDQTLNQASPLAPRLRLVEAG
ncbi:Hint domain-containing protein [Caulobacter soli]|uniref:Hint domain-containing protein n=1 Tax=Caulobacter soli TaxID=2708539 RepID=UPI00196ADB77|nr:Hint domain-containing protein [Caulobacter soli]